ncbi:MAG TPA: hypothetical protein VMV10_10235 [Pirellulales bacterium]|nr:hypothetical protein [Pirellulales bacterium]
MFDSVAFAAPFTETSPHAALVTRFVILSQPRTGSSLLNTSLRSHPDVYMDQEILNHLHPHDLPWNGYQRLRASLSRPNFGAVGCSLHAFQPARHWERWTDWEAAWDALSDDPTIKVIHLTREDVIAQLASWKIADETGQWGPQRDVTERPVVRIDPQELRWFREWNACMYERRLSILRRHETFRLTYESLRDSWDETMRAIQEFLGVPIKFIQPLLTRNERRLTKDVVQNWDELQGE